MLLIKRIGFIFISAFFLLSLTACNTGFLYVQVSGAQGSVELKDGRSREVLLVNDNKLYKFKKPLKQGDSYNVTIVRGSDTSNGHLCRVSGGSNGDGSGTASDSSGARVNVTCVGV